MGLSANGHTAETAYRAAVGDLVGERKPLLQWGVLAGMDVNRPVSLLSTGQQRRLELAIMLAREPEVLILDEPTNHLSLPLITDLEAQLPDYPGAVIIASHDRRLRHTWTGSTLDLG